MSDPEFTTEINSETKPKIRRQRTDAEREYHRKYQVKYYHEKSKLMTVCENCGRKVTEKVLTRHKRSAACRKIASGSEVTFKDGVDQLELLFGTLNFKEANGIIDRVLDGETSLQAATMETFGDAAKQPGLQGGNNGETLVQTCSEISAMD